MKGVWKFTLVFLCSFIVLYLCQFETRGKIYFPSIQFTLHTKVDKMVLVDRTRNRKIPVAIYQADSRLKIKNMPVVIFNHGYGKNSKRSYLAYSDITRFLASKGYVVISIQHEQPYDSRLPMQGYMPVVRLPFWIRGSKNIEYTVNYFKNSKIGKDWDFNTLILIGHSNGGDIAAYYTKNHHEDVSMLITLDHLRMKLPLLKDVKVASLRGSNHQPDKEVLPNLLDQRKFNISLFYLPTVHDNFSNLSSGYEEKLTNSYLHHLLTNYMKYLYD